MQYIKLLRPHQWIKNLIVFFPLILTFNLSIDGFLHALAIFIAFSFVASSIYIFNDIQDIHEDRNHPTKKNRPLASGKIPLIYGYAISGILLLSSLLIAYQETIAAVIFIFTYFILNVTYSLYFKKHPPTDVVCISIGFCLRILSGGPGIKLIISPWLLLATFFCTLTLGFLKRKIELEKNANKSRAQLDYYTPVLLSQIITLCSSIAFFSFIGLLFTFSKPILMFSIIPLTLIYFQILWHAYKNKEGEDFSKLLMKDKKILLYSLIFISFFFLF